MKGALVVRKISYVMEMVARTIRSECLYPLCRLRLDVKLIPEEEIWAEFWRRYGKRPEAWRIYSGVSAKGYPELLISGENESWLVRRESLFSGKLGVGGRISEEFKVKPSVAPYGFREVSRRHLDKVVALVEGGIDPSEGAKTITDILKKPPTTLDRVRSPGVIQGPMVHSYRALPLISKEQMELDRRLDVEMEKWRRRLHYIG